MYKEFLETCTEIELFAFIDSFITSRLQTLDDIDFGRYPISEDIQVWLKESLRNIDAGQESARTRFVKTCYADWHLRMRNLFQGLTQNHYISILKRMPWNCEPT